MRTRRGVDRLGEGGEGAEAMFKALLKAAAEEKEESWNDDWKTTKGGKGKGKGKGGGKGSTVTKFVNEDGTEQGRCWDYDTDGKCTKDKCWFAHVSWTTGKNENVPKGKGGGGKGTGGSRGWGDEKATRRVIGNGKKTEGNDPNTPAGILREKVKNALIDPAGLEDQEKGVEVALRTDLETARDLAEEDENTKKDKKN